MFYSAFYIRLGLLLSALIINLIVCCWICVDRRSRTATSCLVVNVLVASVVSSVVLTGTQFTFDWVVDGNYTHAPMEQSCSQRKWLYAAEMASVAFCALVCTTAVAGTALYRFFWSLWQTQPDSCVMFCFQSWLNGLLAAGLPVSVVCLHRWLSSALVATWFVVALLTLLSILVAIELLACCRRIRRTHSDGFLDSDSSAFHDKDSNQNLRRRPPTNLSRIVRPELSECFYDFRLNCFSMWVAVLELLISFGPPIAVRVAEGVTHSRELPLRRLGDVFRTSPSDLRVAVDWLPFVYLTTYPLLLICMCRVARTLPASDEAAVPRYNLDDDPKRFSLNRPTLYYSSEQVDLISSV